MLSEEARKHVDRLKELLDSSDSSFAVPSVVELEDVKWVVDTLVAVDDRVKQHAKCCVFCGKEST